MAHNQDETGEQRIYKSSRIKTYSLMVATIAMLIVAFNAEDFLRARNKGFLFNLLLFASGSTSCLFVNLIANNQKGSTPTYAEEAERLKLMLITEIEGKKRAAIEDAEATIQAMRMISDTMDTSTYSREILQFILRNEDRIISRTRAVEAEPHSSPEADSHQRE